MPVDLDYYAILQLKPGSSLEEVRDQWRRLAKAYHPDKHAGDRRFEEQLRLINLAYEELRDPARKAAYDRRFPPEPPPVKPAPKPAPSPSSSKPSSSKPSSSKPSSGPPPKSSSGPLPAKSPAPGSQHMATPAPPVFRRRRIVLALVSAAAVLVLLIVWQLAGLLGDSSVSTPMPAGGAAPPSAPLAPAVTAAPVKPAGTDDPGWAIAAERAQDAQRLAALKAPLARRYQAALPAVNALLAQSDRVLPAGGSLSEPALSPGRWDQAGLLARLAADAKTLRAARDQAQAGLDGMQWYGTGSMWESQALEVENALQEMETSQGAVSDDIKALSRSSPPAADPAH